MKLVLIACDQAHSPEVLRLLADAGAHNYTKWIGVQGKGAASGPHLGTPVWPKQNHAFAVAVEDAQARQIVDAVRTLRGTLPMGGVKAFVLPIEDAT